MTAVLEEVGWVQEVIVNKRTGLIVDGHLRVELAAERGESVPLKYVDLSEDEERLILATFDPIGNLAELDPDVFGPLVNSLNLEDERLAALLNDMAHTSQADGLSDAASNERGGIADNKPSPRVLPLDATFTFSGLWDASVFAAYSAGFGIGCRSDVPHLMNEKYISRWEWRYKLRFIDNNYHKYDHERHKAVLARHRPKYATVRDIMSRQQCRDAGVEYYDFDQIMTWAEELSEYAEHIIVIPKIDVIDNIPKDYVLGYSVPTKYGGTQMPTSLFAGRPIHLLGGSWDSQLRYLTALRDDVVSIDFNHLHYVARFGIAVAPDGSKIDLQAHGFTLTNHLTVAVAMSLGHIGRALINMGVGESFVEDELPDAASEGDFDGIER